uniref:Neurotransmitter-gated ion-channel ligand-binding domain-containing protein n=1 Tax=Panagrolaimus davidi TaxID=227884 RepID=A0A914R3R5_9BILA
MTPSNVTTLFHGFNLFSVILGISQVSQISQKYAYELNTKSPPPLFFDDECDPANDTISQYVLKTIFDDEYNKNTVPSKRGATTVTIEFVIQSIAQVSEITSSFTLDLLFSQIWHDPRLRFDHLTNCLTNLTLGHAVIDKLWTPNVII